jgi:hypothetical protein
MLTIFSNATRNRAPLQARLTIAVVSLLLAGFPPALWAQPPKEPTGAWEIRFNRPGRPPSVSVLKLEKSGDKYVGALTTEQGQTVRITDAQWKDGELSFQVTLERQGQKFNLTYKGKVTGDTVKGQVSLKFLGQDRSFDFEGARKKDEPTFAGLWKVDLKLESGAKLERSVRLKQQGNRLAGSYVGVSGKETDLQAVKVSDGEVSFRVSDEIEGQKVDLNYRAKLAGDQLAGTVQIGKSEQADKLKFAAQRVQSPTAQVAGAWKLTVAYQQGINFNSTLDLVQTGSALTGTYVGEQGPTPIADGLILGDEILFEVARNRDGKSYKLKYTGTVAGDTIKGSVAYNFDGLTGSLDFEGKRVGGIKKP